MDDELAGAVLDALRTRGLTLAVAEGDTGGLVLTWLTSVPGSSSVVLGGVVAYHDRLKEHMLGVEASLLREHGSVSGQVAEAMAHGARRIAGADLGLAATGIAGPGGATDTKAVGLTWVAVADQQRASIRRHDWQADRATNRSNTARAVLELALEHLKSRDIFEHMC